MKTRKIFAPDLNEYWSDPANRGPGFLLTFLANALLLLGSVAGALFAYAR